MKNILIVFLLVALNSCKQDGNSLIEKEASIDYRSFLLKSEENVPTFDFPINSSIDEVFDMVDQYTQQNCFDSFSFNYKIDDYEIHSMALEYCHESPAPWCGKILYLEVNDSQTIYVDQHQIELNNVKKFSNEIFEEHFEFHKYLPVELFMKKGDIEISKKAFSLLIQSYLEYCDTKYEKLYSQKISEATKENLQSFKNKHNLIITFPIWHDTLLSLPPPPPPAHVIDNQNIGEELINLDF